MFQAIQHLFQPPPEAKTFHTAYQRLQAEHHDWGETLDTVETFDKAHGRIEIRRLTASTVLNTYLQWPGVAQVFEYTYQRKHPRTQKVSYQTRGNRKIQRWKTISRHQCYERDHYALLLPLKT